MKALRIFTLIFLLGSAGTLFAQSSVLAQANNALNQFEAQYHAGANNAQLYETLYSAYKSYRKIADKNPKDRTAQNGLRKVYPHLVNGAVYYSSNNNNARASDFAAAYIDIPLMPAFKMERFSRDNLYPQFCYFVAQEADASQHYNDALKYGELYLNSGDSNTQLRQNIIDMFSKIVNVSIKKKDYSLAEQTIRKLDSLLPNNESVLFGKALLAFNKGDNKNAVQYYDKLYKTRPRKLAYNTGYATASYNYALELMESGKNQLAKDFMRKASGIFKDLASGGNLTIEDRQKYQQNHLNAEGLLAEINKGNGGYFASTGTSSKTNNRPSSYNGYPTPHRPEPQPSIPDKTYMTREELPTLDEFAKDFITTEFEKWKEKGRYESSDEYRARVTIENAEKKKTELNQMAMDKYIAEYSSKIRLDNLRLPNDIVPYDADNQTFLIISPDFGNIILPVPKPEAEAFENQWQTLIIEHPQFDIAKDDHKLALAQLTFRTNNGNRYITDPNAEFIDRKTEINIGIDVTNINIDDNIGGLTANDTKIKKETITVGGSDVDVDIPVTKKKNENLFAIIIANENYGQEAPVPFAHNDGTTFKNYCIKTLGCPDDNVLFFKDATYGQMLNSIAEIRETAIDFNGNAQIILYYAGHGAPNDETKSAYLIPADGSAKNIRGCYKLDDLYAELSSIPAKSVTVFLDACFSGAQRDGKVLASREGGRAPIIKHKASTPLNGNMIVFSATTEGETAHAHKEQKHGMFTYHILKKFQETKGDISFGDMANYLTKIVPQKSRTINRRSQHPTVTASPSVTEDEWRKWKFRN